MPNFDDIDLSRKKSIMVITNYRTGSTAFCEYLALKFNLVNCDEVFSPSDSQCLYDNVQNKNIILKVMPDHNFEKYFQDLLEKCVVIGLIRQNIFEQIASMAIASFNDLYHVVKPNSIQQNVFDSTNFLKFPEVFTDDYVYPISTDKLENHIRYILDLWIEYYSKFHQHTNFLFYYEDIKTELSSVKYEVYPKPTNYKSLIENIYTIVHSNQHPIIKEKYKEFLDLSTR